MDNHLPKTGSLTLRVVIIVAIIAMVGAAIALTKRPTATVVVQAKPLAATNTATPTAQASTISANPTFSATSASIYKDGTYASTGTYTSPGGRESIAVSIVLVKDVVTEATVTAQATDRESLGYQQRFVSGYKQYVLGKPIADLHLSTVSGSSLTPKGFNAAITTIMTEAKS